MSNLEKFLNSKISEDINFFTFSTKVEFDIICSIANNKNEWHLLPDSWRQEFESRI